jgi:hypothetical protein
MVYDNVAAEEASNNGFTRFQDALAERLSTELDLTVSTVSAFVGLDCTYKLTGSTSVEIYIHPEHLTVNRRFVFFQSGGHLLTVDKVIEDANAMVAG